MSCEVFELPFSQINLRVQFLEVSFVELSGDSFVDFGGHRVLPERLVFLRRIETSNNSRTGDNTQSANHIETTT